MFNANFSNISAISWYVLELKWKTKIPNCQRPILQNTAANRRNRSKNTQIHDGTGISII